MNIVIDFSEENFDIEIFEILEEFFTSSFPNALNLVFNIGLDIKTILKEHKEFLKESIFKDKLLIIFDENYEDVMFKRMQQTTVQVDYFGDLEEEFFDADGVVYNCLMEKFEQG